MAWCLAGHAPLTTERRCNDAMLRDLADFSNAITSLVAAAGPLVVAIRTGANRHISGLRWGNDSVATVDQVLPAQDSYSLVIGAGHLLSGRPGPRDTARNLAVLRLDSPMNVTRPPEATEPAPGTIVLLVGAGFDGAPTARLGMAHGRPHGNGLDGGLVLDVQARDTEAGGIVLDAAGQILGIAAPNAAGQFNLIPAAAIAALAEPAAGNGVGGPTRGPPLATVGTRRGWLGVSLQPITVPEPLVARAGQTSGRMVVNLTHGGPAEEAGLRVGDVVLALNGHSTSGSHALRAFLGADRIGTQIEVRLLRDGTVLSTYLTVAMQPN